MIRYRLKGVEGKYTQSRGFIFYRAMAPGNGAGVQTKQRTTRVLKVDVSKIGHFVFDNAQQSFLGNWKIQLSEDSPDAANVLEAASLLRDSDLPVAFPTETVYGLGADATRSSAVRGIYSAKQRPADNPLIIHISSLSQLRSLLIPSWSTTSHDSPLDYVPQIYHSLISRFWPGPLTILLPLPTLSPLAPEVTTSLPTVAVRMPSSPLALALIQLAGVPLAAPSANASSKPSPTTAAHVLHDLCGRIDLILDGGPCTVGVESTVVDGLTVPPVILRPGGVSIDTLRDCPGWKNVRVAYKDGAETGVPRAPGMKYKHYSPNAKVLLFHGRMDDAFTKEYLNGGSIGVLTTKAWRAEVLRTNLESFYNRKVIELDGQTSQSSDARTEGDDSTLSSVPSAQHFRVHLGDKPEQIVTDLWTIGLGPQTADIARCLFSALREFDQMGVDIICVEGINDNEGDAAAAVMNRLRKAAEAEINL